MTTIALTSTMNWQQPFQGLPISATGPNGDSATMTYDATARPQTTTSPYGAVTSYTYNDGASPPTKAAATNLRQVVTTMDGFGRTVQAVTLDADMTVYDWGYTLLRTYHNTYVTDGEGCSLVHLCPSSYAANFIFNRLENSTVKDASNTTVTLASNTLRLDLLHGFAGGDAARYESEHELLFSGERNAEHYAWWDSVPDLRYW